MQRQSQKINRERKALRSHTSSKTSTNVMANHLMMSIAILVLVVYTVFSSLENTKASCSPADAFDEGKKRRWAKVGREGSKILSKEEKKIRTRRLSEKDRRPSVLLHLSKSFVLLSQ